MRHRSRTDTAGQAHEIILVNAHDGTSSYQMISGVFRFVCANGLFAGDAFEEVKVRHTGDAVGQVIEGAYTVLEDADAIMADVAEMQGTRLTEREQGALAKAAHVLRFDDPDTAPISADRLLAPRRRADGGDDLWSTFNRVQENVIRGGLSGISRDAQGRRRRRTVREVTGIDQTKALNRALWTLAEELGAHKAAA